MRNLLSRFLIVAAAFALGACAPQLVSEQAMVNPVLEQNRTNVQVYGVERAEVLSSVFYTGRGDCSVIKFQKYVTSLHKDADDVINVRMEVIGDSCSYSGLAVRYTPLDIDEAERWARIGDSPTSFPVVNPDREKELAERERNVQEREDELSERDEPASLGWPIFGSVAVVAASVVTLLLVFLL